MRRDESSNQPTYAQGDTIAAPATATGGAIAVIRVSGPDAVSICDGVFRSESGRPLCERRGGSAVFGRVVSADGQTIDETVATVFRAPHSYTGEDTVELSCHGSSYIIQTVLELLCKAGARVAAPGEFTMRAFLAGKLDLSQAEAVADIIAAGDKAAHRIAYEQMRGGYRCELTDLRERLLRLASLLELELDFSEEDVEFTDRDELRTLLKEIIGRVDTLAASFTLGNAIKNGVPAAIVGAPNVGKSTLLNALLGEQRAMVSDIPGTTRDTVEGRLNVGGISYRLTDTAGLRKSSDRLEQMGIERSYAAAAASAVVLLVYDIRALATLLSGAVHKASAQKPCEPKAQQSERDFTDALAAIGSKAEEFAAGNQRQVIVVLNKADAVDSFSAAEVAERLSARLSFPVVAVSAKCGRGLGELVAAITSGRDADTILASGSIVSNARHYEAFVKMLAALRSTLEGLDDGLPTDLVLQNLREALFYAGTVTGQVITSDAILEKIFSSFCIGK